MPTLHQRPPSPSRRHLASLLALLCAGLLGSGALAEPPIPVESGQTDPVTLRYRYQPGETLQYRFTIEEQTSLSDISTSRRSDLSLTGTVTLALVVQRVDEQGNAVVTEELRQPSFDVDADGFDLSSRDLARGLAGVARTIELSPGGELLDEEVQASAENEAARALAVELARLGETLRLELPEEAIEVGETFRIEESSRGDGVGFDRRRSLALTFLGWARVGTRSCAVLEVGGDEWRELAAGTSAGDIRGPALSRGVYHGYLYFDPTAGRLVRGDVEMGSVGQVGGTASPLDLTQQTHWTAELAE